MLEQSKNNKSIYTVLKRLNAVFFKSSLRDQSLGKNPSFFFPFPKPEPEAISSTVHRSTSHIGWAQWISEKWKKRIYLISYKNTCLQINLFF